SSAALVLASAEDQMYAACARSPPPCGEGSGVGVSQESDACDEGAKNRVTSIAFLPRLHPTPNPSPSRRGEPVELGAKSALHENGARLRPPASRFRRGSPCPSLTCRP